mmetsp:Transcript_33065/g.51181  ORF Transcript_33065/g.51181 Transcript_33065/m.51181 type:complete len:376 (-) Transcript_33065:144-1271(-)
MRSFVARSRPCLFPVLLSLAFRINPPPAALALVPIGHPGHRPIPRNFLGRPPPAPLFTLGALGGELGDIPVEGAGGDGDGGEETGDALLVTTPADPPPLPPPPQFPPDGPDLAIVIVSELKANAALFAAFAFGALNLPPALTVSESKVTSVTTSVSVARPLPDSELLKAFVVLDAVTLCLMISCVAASQLLIYVSPPAGGENPLLRDPRFTAPFPPDVFPVGSALLMDPGTPRRPPRGPRRRSAGSSRPTAPSLPSRGSPSTWASSPSSSPSPCGRSPSSTAPYSSRSRRSFSPRPSLSVSRMCAPIWRCSAPPSRRGRRTNLVPTGAPHGGSSSAWSRSRSWPSHRTARRTDQKPRPICPSGYESSAAPRGSLS